MHYAFYAVDMIGATLNLVDPRYSVEGIHEYIEEVDSPLRWGLCHGDKVFLLARGSLHEGAGTAQAVTEGVLFNDR